MILPLIYSGCRLLRWWLPAVRILRLLPAFLPLRSFTLLVTPRYLFWITGCLPWSGAFCTTMRLRLPRSPRRSTVFYLRFPTYTHPHFTHVTIVVVAEACLFIPLLLVTHFRFIFSRCTFTVDSPHTGVFAFVYVCSLLQFTRFDANFGNLRIYYTYGPTVDPYTVGVLRLRYIYVLIYNFFVCYPFTRCWVTTPSLRC